VLDAIVGLIVSYDPTAAILFPLTDNALASEKEASTVMMLPLTKAKSAECIMI
jgi:hypothetical protein